MSPAPQIVCEVSSAVELMMSAVPISPGTARAVLRALAKGGYTVAPIEPTNSMFGAYIGALNNPAITTQTLIANVGKARRRWKAMALAGMKVTFSEAVRPAKSTPQQEQRSSPNRDPDGQEPGII